MAACSQGQRAGDQSASGPAAATTPLPQAASAAPAPATAIPRIDGRFSPRDECAELPGWKPFAEALRAAIAKRDPAALAALASQDVKLDFGGGGGRAELIRRLNDRSNGNLWEELDQVVALGCAKGSEPASASMPWFFEQGLDGEDPFEVALVAGSDVLMLSAADAKARPLARLGWVLVKPVEDGDWNAPIRKVRLIGREGLGFVESRFLRSQIDYRLIAQREGEAWKIVALLAGD